MRSALVVAVIAIAAGCGSNEPEKPKACAQLYQMLDQLEKAGFPKAFAQGIAPAVDAWPWWWALVLLLLVYLYAHYAFASLVVHVIGAHLLPDAVVQAPPVERADDAIVWLIRFPRVVVAAVVGAGLATAGVIMQSLFRNPLAEPSLTGVGPGAVLGADRARSANCN